MNTVYILEVHWFLYFQKPYKLGQKQMIPGAFKSAIPLKVHLIIPIQGQYNPFNPLIHIK